MGSVNLQLLHLTDQSKPTMKLLLIASLFVLSVFAEPEAEADAQWYGYNWNNGYYPMSYGYNRWSSGSWNYNRYNMYNRNFWGNRRFYREAEAEPEADAQYYNNYYGYSPMRYNMYNRNYNGYNMYNRNFWNYNRFYQY